MKIKIERLEIEVPGLTESILKHELERDRNHNSLVGGLYHALLTLLSVFLNKSVGVPEDDTVDPLVPVEEGEEAVVTPPPGVEGI